VADGGALYVPFTLPGETVGVRRYGPRGQVVHVVDPSPDRVAPVCRHFGRCGGCAVQHASDGFVAAWKRDLVASALAARGWMASKSVRY